MLVFRVCLVRIFPHSDWIWRDTEYIPVFSPKSEKYGPGKLRIQEIFTQCHLDVLEPSQMSNNFQIGVKVYKIATREFLYKCSFIIVFWSFLLWRKIALSNQKSWLILVFCQQLLFFSKVRGSGLNKSINKSSAFYCGLKSMDLIFLICCIKL